MVQILEDKLQIKLNRMALINSDIESHRESIKLLLEAAVNNWNIKKTPHAPRIIKYNAIPRSEARLEWTLQNIRIQIKLLEQELETLIKYGE